MYIRILYLIEIQYITPIMRIIRARRASELRTRRSRRGHRPPPRVSSSSSFIRQAGPRGVPRISSPFLSFSLRILSRERERERERWSCVALIGDPLHASPAANGLSFCVSFVLRFGPLLPHLPDSGARASFYLLFSIVRSISSLFN